jgi:hypothetical protein
MRRYFLLVFLFVISILNIYLTIEIANMGYQIEIFVEPPTYYSPPVEVLL